MWCTRICPVAVTTPCPRPTTISEAPRLPLTRSGPGVAPGTSYRKPSVPASRLRGCPAHPAQLPPARHLGVTRENASVSCCCPPLTWWEGLLCWTDLGPGQRGAWQRVGRGPQPRLAENKLPLFCPFRVWCSLLSQTWAPPGLWCDTCSPGQGGPSRRRWAPGPE